MDRIFMMLLNTKVENQTPTNYISLLVGTLSKHFLTFDTAPTSGSASSQCGDNVFLEAIPRFSTMEEIVFLTTRDNTFERGESPAFKISMQKDNGNINFTTTHRSWTGISVQMFRCFENEKRIEGF